MQCCCIYSDEDEVYIYIVPMCIQLNLLACILLIFIFFSLLLLLCFTYRFYSAKSIALPCMVFRFLAPQNSFMVYLCSSDIIIDFYYCRFFESVVCGPRNRGRLIHNTFNALIAWILLYNKTLFRNLRLT